MDALLVLNNENIKNCRVLVHIYSKQLKERVITLLEQDKGCEAFDALVKYAQVKAYLPGDTQPPRVPLLLTLDEQLIKKSL